MTDVMNRTFHQIELDRIDAERYRALRDREDVRAHAYKRDGYHYIMELERGAALDEKIDAAMGKTVGHKGSRMTETEKERVLDALKPGHGLPEPKRYERLRDMPADELAHRVVGSLILQKGNLNEYKRVIEALIINMRNEYEIGNPEGA